MNFEEHLVEEPAWIQALSDMLVDCVKPLSLMGSFGYRFLLPNSPTNPNPCWIVAFYPTPSEAYGGAYDGSLIFPGFSLDLARFLSGFSRTISIDWNAPSVYTGELDGPEISIKGYFAAKQVWVRIFSTPPSDEEPTLVVDLASGDSWEPRSE